MDSFTLGILVLLFMLAITGLGVPIAFSMMIAAFGGMTLLVGLPQAMAQFNFVIWDQGSNYLYITIPLFVFMGQMVLHAGLATDFYDCVHKWFGRMPGGLAVAATVAGGGLGAVTGSSYAAVATLASMTTPEMRRYGYDMRLASGAIAASGTLAILIPPSVVLVIYGIWTETSIGALFIAGIVPGAILLLAFLAVTIGWALLDPKAAPPGPRFSWRERIVALTKLLPVLILFAAVLVTIYLGISSPSESAAIGAVGAVAIAAAMGRLSFRSIGRALEETGLLSGMIFAVAISGVLFSRFLVQTDVTNTMANFLLSLDLHAYLIILILVVMYLILGMALDTLAMIILTLPFVLPIVLGLGYDKVWFGVFLTILVEVALITPPVGLNAFILNASAPDVSLRTIFVGCIPFVMAILVVIALLTVFPAIALWLPATMR